MDAALAARSVHAGADTLGRASASPCFAEVGNGWRARSRMRRGGAHHACPQRDSLWTTWQSNYLQF